MEVEPVIAVEQSSITSREQKHLWNIGWRLINKCAGSLRIVSARLPHGRFRSEEQRFEPPLILEAGGEVQFRALVQCDEPAGLVTENAFIIFQVIWLGESWRIFIRIRVLVNGRGEPETRVELITTQKVGFSGRFNT